MNLLLLFEKDFEAEGQVVLRDRRFVHIRDVLRTEVGGALLVGRANGDIGRGTVIQLDGDAVKLEVAFDVAPPPALPLTLILGLPRPQQLKRTLQTVAAMGVKDIILLHSSRVEKSYWHTPVLTEESIAEHLSLGLEQAVDTVMPRVRLCKRFKPFVEDELPGLAVGTRALVAHPYNAVGLPVGELTPSILAIGPEGGFTKHEIEMLQAAGLMAVHMGPRILRVETAVPALLGHLFPTS